MKFAYADPPYLGYGKLYPEHPNAAIWDDPETHRQLVNRLCDEYLDGWALSLSSPSLRIILPMTPDDCRIGSWVRPFAAFKANVSPAYAWEPLIWRGGRKHDYDIPCELIQRDWIAESITLRRGLTGAKPRNFCRWMFSLLGAIKGDILDDLFPGTNAIGAAWNEWIGDRSPLPLLPLESFMQTVPK